MPEVERKFRLPAVPAEILAFGGVPVIQGYVVSGPGELRVRKEGSLTYMTVKGDGTLARDEWEARIPAWVFEMLWTHTEGRRIEKTRYVVPYEGHVLQIDVYERALLGLVTLECEFGGEDAARGFTLPSWAGPSVDVTADPAYKNKTLASEGLPD